MSNTTALPAAYSAADPAADPAASPTASPTADPSTFFSLPTDESANEVLAVFVGVGFLWLLCIVLSFTVVASTLREMRYWVLRTSRAERAERELSEATGLPASNEAFRPNEILDGEDYDGNDGDMSDPPLLCPAAKI